MQQMHIHVAMDKGAIDAYMSNMMVQTSELTTKVIHRIIRASSSNLWGLV